jgi:hypothetical protein
MGLKKRYVGIRDTNEEAKRYGTMITMILMTRMRRA